MKYDFVELIKHFNIEGEFIEAVPYGFGHINDTFAAIFKRASGGNHRYIIQRINQNVFKSPENLMENIEGITKHVRKKVIAAGGDPDRETLNIIPTVDGISFYKTPEGDYWRVYIFIEKAQTFQIVENIKHFYNAGNAFGKFQKLVSDYPASKLHETIVNFHNTAKRYEAFKEALTKDVINRAASVKAEIDFVEKRANETSVIINLLQEGKLPLRVTHNDTKFNNVIIDDKTGKGICVIDLDTVMPGSSLYDFGDSIRSGTNLADEDELDLSKVCMDLELFESFTHGFLDSARDFLTPIELEYLPFGAKMMTLECGIRFLTDYLSGDVYFKIHRENHNLDRCRTQFKMVADMEEKNKQMKAIVDKYK
ncbi:MAG TPA: phosphotransferase [Ruminiclostridium sp.]